MNMGKLSHFGFKCVVRPKTLRIRIAEVLRADVGNCIVIAKYLIQFGGTGLNWVREKFDRVREDHK